MSIPGFEPVVATAEIRARELWNATGILLRADHGYRITVDHVTDWRDASVRTTPAGYELWYLRPFNRAKRFRGAPWYALIGTIGQSLEASFLIGEGVERLKPGRDGELFCFANDASFMYWNNRGTLIIAVADLGVAKLDETS